MARPTDYSEEKITLAREYIEGGWKEQGDSVPQIAGLAMAMGVDRTTLYDWSGHEDKAEFSDIFTRVKAMQERNLINGGLSGEFNPAITKMLLVKHGYSERQEIDHRSPDGSMSPTRIELVAKNADGAD